MNVLKPENAPLEALFNIAKDVYEGQLNKKARYPKWRPISSAPKDRLVLVWEAGPYLATWISKPPHGEPYWAIDVSDQELTHPTHWLPLPDPPKDE